MISKTTLSDATLYECTIEGCPRVTTVPENPDPRLRWVINLILSDDDGTSKSVNLCPHHVREYLNLTEEHYQLTENAERFVRTGSTRLSLEDTH